MSNSNHNREKTELTIQGMHCTNCALGIERHLKGVGVEDISVDFATASASFTPSSSIDLPFVAKEIEKLGYRGEQQIQSVKQSRRLNSIENKFLFSLLFTLPLFVHTFLPFHFLHNTYLQLALSTPVFLLGFFHFGRSSWLSLKAKFPNMDVLIFIGITAAFAYSLVGTLFSLGPSFAFYETAATITTVVFLGNLLEARSVKKTTSAIEELTQLQATRAKLIETHAGTESIREIDSKDIRPNDIFLVNSGDKIPTDGEVSWGQASLNESIISGESLPVEKIIGDHVIGGTVVVNGSIKFRATAVGQHTVLATMIRLVKDAQRNKPRIQRLGDEVSAIFVPVVLGISLLTLILSYFVFGVPFGDSLLRSIAVLVIACPCAMGLATPTAVMVGIGQAAKHGILIKGGDTLEKLAKVKQIIFDKTGTITSGEFVIKKIESFGNRDQEFLKSVLLALENHSSHPIASSIREALKGYQPYPLFNVTEQSGLGMRGEDQLGNRFAVGSFALVENQSSDNNYDLYIIENDRLIGAANLEDRPKDRARETIQALKNMGLRLILLSGDKQRKCELLAREVGITTVYAERKPKEKLHIIEQEETQSPTAFVGDGINDAPALARAAVGISLSDATEAAIQSAQVVLLKGRFESLHSAVVISRKTLRVIKQNLFWAFCYNVFAIPVAAYGILNPTIACIAMALSDVVVVGNSLRLKWWKG